MYAGNDLGYVVQCRLDSLPLKTEISNLATAVYGSLAPSVSLHGQLGPSRDATSCKEPLLVYLMTRLPGITQLDFVLSRPVAQFSEEFFPFRRNLFTGIASFFAQSWLALEHVSSQYRDDLKAGYLRDLQALGRGLPERFKPAVQESYNWAVRDKPTFCQAFTGSMHLRNGWSRFPDYEDLGLLFWLHFAEEVGGTSEQTLTTIKKTRVLGFLLSHGFTSRLANEATPTPLKDDEHGRYHMMLLDGYLINAATKMGGVV
ncbi:hypothetical protein NLG97_g1718 [Lecanicillium saksenae]|uniref:Uncharacterized protein n=1 Tax=Lecanicillium saksenae TaxID=468837 RepID=A0ACC1R4U9_9HYPO|nr:hypothetical protein NLG97_g1718 [Lecanicillium saksenae]